jgi:hypothetical protein
MSSVDLAYGHVGLYVGPLNEQHPWLYKAYLLMRNGAAQEYRQRVLGQRGMLRGVDCVLMGEIARADEERVMTLTARSVAEQVQQRLPVPAVEAAQEPQAAGSTAPLAVLTEGAESDPERASQSSTVRAFAPLPADRRAQG